MTDVLLVTCSAFPDGEPGGELLLTELEGRGISAAWAVWDDESVDWGSARAVMVRSTWDYWRRRSEFLDWARRVEKHTRMLVPARVLEWNTDKVYLLDLIRAGLPVVPTVPAEDESELPTAIAEFGRAVVKPRVGGHGDGVVVFDGLPPETDDEPTDESRLEPGPWIVQPLVESVHTEGESSVFVFGREPRSQVDKLPGEGEIRVHKEYGGQEAQVPLSAEHADLARWTVQTAEELLGEPLPFARVDVMRLADGTLAVGELELTEPGLYLDIVPENAGPFVDAVLRWLDGQEGPGHRFAGR